MSEPGICAECGLPGAVCYAGNDTDHTVKFYHILCMAKSQLKGHTETLKWTRPTARAYLAAMIDGEGHIRKDSGRTEIINNDIGIIAASKSACDHLGIPTRVRISCRKFGYPPTFALSLLGGKTTRRKLMRLPLASVAKKEVLLRYV